MKIKDFTNPNRPNRAKRLLRQLNDFVESDAYKQFDEGRKYITVNKRERIGIDLPVAPNQQVHAHLPDGNVVNKDGTPSHGDKAFYIKNSWADALRAADFKIKKGGLVESADSDMVTIQIPRTLFELLKALKKHVG